MEVLEHESSYLTQRVTLPTISHFLIDNYSFNKSFSKVGGYAFHGVILLVKEGCDEVKAKAVNFVRSLNAWLIPYFEHSDSSCLTIAFFVTE